MGAPVRIAAVVVVLLACALPGDAFAAYPGANGRIAFELDENGQILTMDSDGTNLDGLTSDPAFASEPAWSPDGQKVLYTRGRGEARQVWVANADGTGHQQVPTPYNFAFSPTWSPDGTRIAFVSVFIPEGGGAPCTCRFHSVEESNLDGSERRGLYGHFDGTIPFAAVINDVEWSPTGDKIAFTRQIQNGDNSEMLMITGSHGSPYGTHELTGPPSHVQSPAWSPDGKKLAFVEYNFDHGEVYTINPDGTGRQQVTHNSVPEHSVEWSPDGTKLVVSASDRSCQDPPGPCPLHLWLMDPNGANEHRITLDSRHQFDPDWQPVIGAAPRAAYPRPKHASPIRVSLVPAFDACTSPDRTHGPPLTFGSCNPPVESSPYVTVGTGDANGAPANMAGSLRLTALQGNPATAADEADLEIKMSVTDVRCGPQMMAFFCSSANTAGGKDTFANLQGRLSARITDRFNLPAPGGRSSGTTNGYVPFRFDAFCSATPGDQTVGSTCQAVTTLEALYPGAIKEGLRSNFELAQVEIYDGGGDGNTGTGPPEEVFLRQGVFVP